MHTTHTNLPTAMIYMYIIYIRIYELVCVCMFESAHVSVCVYVYIKMYYSTFLKNIGIFGRDFDNKEISVPSFLKV